jgi:methylated-DNA-[protein]-cysteine S-methyltransferase
MSQELFYAVFNTPSGLMGLSASKAGLKSIILPKSSRSSKQVEACLLGSVSDNIIQSSEHFIDLIKRFQAYFSGQRVEFPDKLDLFEATTFQRRVWRAAQEIPYGETRSYTWVAEKIGMPQAARAVGQALGRNPLPVIVPCHRVLASGGGLGGFTGGLEMKKYLLKLEKVKY